MEKTDIIREYYDENPLGEWNRIAGRPEFLLTMRFINRYIKAGDRILDIGGGPGRYSITLAEMGCDVTLLDLSPENVSFACGKAAEHGIRLSALAGDAREASKLVDGQFDHVLLMGPLYHLQTPEGQHKAISEAVSLLKPGGLLFVSFIASGAGIIYMMKHEPTLLASNPLEIEFMNGFIADKPFAGAGFTECFFIRHQDVLPMMARHPLEKLHFFGQEGILAPCEKNILAQSEEVRERWLCLAEQVCEREDLLTWSEHLMYIGRKI